MASTSPCALKGLTSCFRELVWRSRLLLHTSVKSLHSKIGELNIGWVLGITVSITTQSSINPLNSICPVIPGCTCISIHSLSVATTPTKFQLQSLPHHTVNGRRLLWEELGDIHFYRWEKGEGSVGFSLGVLSFLSTHGIWGGGQDKSLVMELEWNALLIS